MKKRFANIFLYLFAFVFFWLLFLYAIKEPELYMFPETAKQGNTLFIKARTRIGEVKGSFLGKEIPFFKKGQYQWTAFLGIDAKLEPGEYTIAIETPKGRIEKKIKVVKAEFPSFKMPLSPSLEKKGYTEEKIIDNMVKKDAPAINEVLSVFTPSPYFDQAFSLPLLKPEQKGLGFGAIIKSPHYELSHYGVDLKAHIGQEVFAINRGRVVLSEELSDYGKTIVLDHGLGIFSLYLHLEEFKASLDDIVEKGEVIGLAGNTGYSTGSHLHFSIKVNHDRVDPLLFIKTANQAEESFFLASVRDILYRFRLY